MDEFTPSEKLDIAGALRLAAILLKEKQLPTDLAAIASRFEQSAAIDLTSKHSESSNQWQANDLVHPCQQHRY